MTWSSTRTEAGAPRDRRHLWTRAASRHEHGVAASCRACLRRTGEPPREGARQAREFRHGRAHDYFATVLCALIDVDAHSLTLASAGHLAPLLINDGEARFVELHGNPPIGVRHDSPYEEKTVSVQPQTTLVAFTDGLVERRGEVLDVGLARLRDAATTHSLALSELLAKLIRDLASDDHHDDTAIVGIRWQR